MSLSEKQLNANRQNAQKSTGPRTVEGKNVSSRNGIKHGLHATDIVINSPNLKEDQSLYDELVQSLFDELQPTGLLQEHLVLKIANCMWRYRRAINAESATVNNQLADPFIRPIPQHLLPEGMQYEDEPEMSAQRAQSRAIPNGHTGLNLLRYEWRLDRELYRSYKLLRILQKSENSNNGEKPKKRC